MREPTGRTRRCLRVAAVALVFAVTALGLTAPVGAVATARPAGNKVGVRTLGGHSLGSTARMVTVPAKKPNQPKRPRSTSNSVRLGRRDYVELALLALSPFVVMGLFLFGSGYRRLKQAPEGSESIADAVVPERKAMGSPTRTALRVPEVAAAFWIVKALSTAMGESTSDYLVHAMPPVAAVLLGFVGFAIAMAVQFSKRRYVAWAYWFAVVMVGVFGTMAADVLHVGFGVPYIASAGLYAVALVAVFVTWHKSEHTLSIHSIDTLRREAFYWAAVVTTFALGTAVGDVTALSLHLGYLTSLLLFTAVIAIPIVGYWAFRWNAILTFWFAYVVTRPLGASFADWLGKPTSAKGIGVGAGTVSLILTTIIAVLAAYLSITRTDVQPEPSNSPAPV